MSTDDKTPVTGPNYCPQCGSGSITSEYAPYSDGKGYHEIDCAECPFSAASDVAEYNGEKFAFVGWPLHIQFTSR